MKQKLSCLVIVALLLCGTLVSRGAEQGMDIERWGIGDANARPIPINLSGFTGEVDSVLRFDLFVMGFSFVDSKEAQYIVQGSNNGRVEGRLFDAISKKEVFGKAFTGGSSRTQAHALADEIAIAVTRGKGIAQTKIAFKVERPGGSEIAVADFDGHNAHIVTSDHTIVAAPTWVPKRRMLYYTSYQLGNPDIFSHNLETGDRHTIARYSGLNTSAAISPDGSRLVMVLSKNGSPNIWVAKADGSNLKQLTNDREGDSSPCWSPDGRTICYSSRAPGKSALYLVSADGGTPRRLTVVGAGNLTEPDWSPDGKWIAFTRQAGAFEICVVPANGGEAKVRVTGEDPSWAPNSRTLVYCRRTNGKRVLSLLDVPTNRFKDVPQSLGSCSQPSWAK